MSRKNIIVGTLALVGLGGMGTRAYAQDCVLPANKLVISGSSAIEPLIKGMAGQLVAAGGIDVFYANVGSCTGTNNFLNGDDLVGKTASHYDAAGAKTTCTLPAGTKSDVGVSDVFLNICNANPPAGYGDFQGPVAAMTFVVPKMSTQTSLVADEGYFVFGEGTAGFNGMHVSPWVNETVFAIRNPGSGTQQMTSKAVGLTGGVMKGTDAGGSGGVVTALTTANATAVTAEPAIGILGADVYDTGTNRTTLKALAFRGFKQTKGYYPDSTPNSFDKRPVRDGHYSIWGPSHIIAKTNAVTGKAENQKVQDLIDYLQLTKALGNANVLNIEIDAHVVPQCAMLVKRVAEMGDISAAPQAAGAACGCYMDEHLAAGSSGCKACATSAECGGLSCSHGFCE